MAANSKNKFDVYVWIKHKVIPSCNTLDQKRSAENLIDNFHRLYKDYDLVRDLYTYLNY